MSRKSVKLLGLLLILLFSHRAIGQFSAAYYGGNQSKLGIAYDLSKRLNIEAKVYASVELDQVVPELSLTCKFLHRSMYSIYTGLSFYAYLDLEYYGPGIPLGTIVRPIPMINSLAFQMEVMPYWTQDVEVAIQTSWGVRYYF